MVQVTLKTVTGRNRQSHQLYGEAGACQGSARPMQQAPSQVLTLHTRLATQLASYGADASVRTFILPICLSCLFAHPLSRLPFVAAQPGTSTVVAVPFLTHFADLSSWEYAQKLQQKGLPELQQMGVKVGLAQQLGMRLKAVTACRPC